MQSYLVSTLNVYEKTGNKTEGEGFNIAKKNFQGDKSKIFYIRKQLLRIESHIDFRTQCVIMT